jgi:2-keto-4-pentenoate hydratase/2-oxohepta-3-ene-1,7-dioic acid hydratase in catechol pathway
MKRFPVMAMLSTFLTACTGAWEPAFHEQFREEERGDVAIADPDEALTFARIPTARGPRVIAVTAWRGGMVEGVDLSAALAREVDDPVTLFFERGYDRLRGDVLAAPPTARVTRPAEQLAIPVDFGDQHIAVGTNYPEHADDVGTTRPFLFPKRVQPGVSGDPVSAGSGLLDYEVEIAVVLLEALEKGTSPRFLGLMLANDFTDRETLMHAVDRNDIESGKGFTTGKSFPGYLPVGHLLVIPRDYRAFARDIELRLFVNDALRQRALGSKMVWDIDEVLTQTMMRGDLRWEHRGRRVALFEGESIPARTLVLTGTPHGTVFSGVPTRVIASGLVRWLLGGWDKSPPEQVIEAYVAAAREATAYLQPSDDVQIHVQRLGQIRSNVVP